jgi:hypothetical protein
MFDLHQTSLPHPGCIISDGRQLLRSLRFQNARSLVSFQHIHIRGFLHDLRLPLDITVLTLMTPVKPKPLRSRPSLHTSSSLALPTLPSTTLKSQMPSPQAPVTCSESKVIPDPSPVFASTVSLAARAFAGSSLNCTLIHRPLRSHSGEHSRSVSSRGSCLTSHIGSSRQVTLAVGDAVHRQSTR